MIKVGIIFGGPSREREVSFAGGRTVYDNLNKLLFEPVPLFVDSHLNFILLSWEYVYKGTIRDFYPPADVLTGSELPVQVYAESFPDAFTGDEFLPERVGQCIPIHELASHIDVAFLALHGHFGEDGKIQSLLEMLDIPYTGSGVKASAAGMDKAWQKKLMAEAGWDVPHFINLSRDQWVRMDNRPAWLQQTRERIGVPFVIRPANQGSSIGVTIVNETDKPEQILKAIDHAFFTKTIRAGDIKRMTRVELLRMMHELADLRTSCGFPLKINDRLFYHPDGLYEYLLSIPDSESVKLEGIYSEHTVVLESFISGREFSCIVIRNEDDTVCALPPTEIIKKSDVYDYRSKYLPGLSRKETPIRLPKEAIHQIRRACEKLYHFFGFQTYARIDGFYTAEGKVFLNDPNTTSGMLPSSFFFHQAASIGLNPSEFLTYILAASVEERRKDFLQTIRLPDIQKKLEATLLLSRDERAVLPRVAVIMGGSSFERHISLESGRNIYEKLASGGRYLPIPVFLTYTGGEMRFFEIPIHDLLKDNADDVRDNLSKPGGHPVLESVKKQCLPITRRFVHRDVIYHAREIQSSELRENFDAVFIALHGRPGEDGTLQALLEDQDLPYNGSGPVASAITIDKYATLQLLKEHGFPVTRQRIVTKAEYLKHEDKLLDQIGQEFSFPLIAKPVDDGCSSAVIRIKSRENLSDYLNLIFMTDADRESIWRSRLGLAANEEFPLKDSVLIETLVEQGDAIHFLEITCGLITFYDESGDLQFKVFQPSETLATGEVLSLAEKFLAGEGQNLTPARLACGSFSYEFIADQVRRDLEKAARIIGIEGYARIDAFVRVMADGQAETRIIEVNSLPGMTPATVIFHQAALEGFKPHEFVHYLLEFGMARQKRQTSVKQ